MATSWTVPAGTVRAWRAVRYHRGRVRRPAEGIPGRGSHGRVEEFGRRAGAGLEGEFAADELADELTYQLRGRADGLRRRGRQRLPPRSRRWAPEIHPVHLRIIEEETRFLSARRGQSRRVAGRAGPRHDVREAALRGGQAGAEARPRRRPQAQGSRHAGPMSAGSARSPATPGPPGNCPPLRSWPRGSTSSSAPWTCAPPGCPAPCRTSGSALT